MSALEALSAICAPEAIDGLVAEVLGGVLPARALDIWLGGSAVAKMYLAVPVADLIARSGDQELARTARWAFRGAVPNQDDPSGEAAVLEALRILEAL